MAERSRNADFLRIPLSSITSRAACSRVSPTSTKPASTVCTPLRWRVCCASEIASSRRIATIMRGQFAGSNVHGSGCTTSPIRFCWHASGGRSNRKIYASDKIRRAGSPPSQLERVPDPDPAHGATSMSRRRSFWHHPRRLALPLANMQRMLADKIKLTASPCGNSPQSNHNFCS